jgi:hypothetical protein
MQHAPRGRTSGVVRSFTWLVRLVWTWFISWVVGALNRCGGYWGPSKLHGECHPWGSNLIVNPHAPYPDCYVLCLDPALFPRFTTTHYSYTNPLTPFRISKLCWLTHPVRWVTIWQSVCCAWNGHVIVCWTWVWVWSYIASSSLPTTMLYWLHSEHRRNACA